MIKISSSKAKVLYQQLKDIITKYRLCFQLESPVKIAESVLLCLLAYLFIEFCKSSSVKYTRRKFCGIDYLGA